MLLQHQVLFGIKLLEYVEKDYLKIKNEPSITIMTNIPRVVSISIKNSFVIILLLLFVPIYFTII